MMWHALGLPVTSINLNSLFKRGPSQCLTRLIRDVSAPQRPSWSQWKWARLASSASKPSGKLPHRRERLPESERAPARFGIEQDLKAGKLFFDSRLQSLEYTPETEEFAGRRIRLWSPQISRSGVLWSFIFTGAVGLVAFMGASYWTSYKINALSLQTPGSNPTLRTLEATRLRLDLESAKKSVSWFERHTDRMLVQNYARIRSYWLEASEGKKAAVVLIAVNAVVLLMWRIRIPVMESLFTHKVFLMPYTVPTMLTSVFSHQSFLHFGFNMMALYSFAGASSYYMSSLQAQSGERINTQTTSRPWAQDMFGRYHFLAFFVTAGVAASLGSTLWTVYMVNRTLRLGQLERAARLIMTGGLGASGAVYSTVVVSALANPDSSVSLIFLPMIPINIQYGVTGMVALDMYGLWAGWSRFGHAAHLAGAAFGGFYYFFGPQIWANFSGNKRPYKSFKAT